MKKSIKTQRQFWAALERTKGKMKWGIKKWKGRGRTFKTIRATTPDYKFCPYTAAVYEAGGILLGLDCLEDTDCAFREAIIDAADDARSDDPKRSEKIRGLRAKLLKVLGLTEKI